MFDIITFAFPMVEFYRKEQDNPLNEYGELIGPFAAGDPLNVVSTAVKQGHKGACLGVKGNDRLAECFTQSLERNGIDTSHVRTDPEHITGLSLLAKFSDGSREFVFTLRDSAAAQLGKKEEDYDQEFLDSTRVLHVTGVAYAVSDSIAELIDKALSNKKEGQLVTFDPNFREALISKERFAGITKKAFDACDVFLPSMGEAGFFVPDAKDEEDACRRIAAMGKMVVLKDGGKGARAFYKGEERFFPAYKVEEVDPTGAGDTFSGSLISALLDGKEFFEAVKYGAAGGAICVTRVGVLDVPPTKEEVEAFIKDRE